MKEIVLVLIIAVGIVGIGVGFAQNSIPLSVEDLGLGEDFIQSPISSYSVVLEKTKVCTFAGCKTFNTACLFESVDSILGPATIICKLTDGSGISNDGDPTNDKFGKVIAEGRKDLSGGYPGAHSVQRIPITQFAFPNSNQDKNIKDIKIVTIGPPVT